MTAATSHSSHCVRAETAKDGGSRSAGLVALPGSSLSPLRSLRASGSAVSQSQGDMRSRCSQ